MVRVKPLADVQVQQLRNELAPADEPKKVLETASSLLAEITEMAGVVLLPRRERMTLRHVEFLPLSGERVLTSSILGSRRVTRVR